MAWLILRIEFNYVNSFWAEGLSAKDRMNLSHMQHVQYCEVYIPKISFDIYLS